MSALVVGLTGGIGSGKSTVAAMLVDRGATLIDADAITRELQAPGQPVLAAIVARFGTAVVGPDGTLDRQALADVVFPDPVALADLNAIVHPAVGVEIARRLEEATATGGIVVLDIPLLVESGRDDLAATIVVDVDPEVAVERLVRHRGLDPDDARARQARQAGRDERLARADHVVANDGDLDALAAEVDRCWAWLTRLHDEQAAASGT
jgi:dephospho-CoA kinase